MRTTILSLPVLLLVLASACQPKDTKQVSHTPEHHDSIILLPDSLLHFLTDKGLITGTCVIYQQTRDVYYVFNDSLAHDRRMPASTFKVFNSLVALETGVIEGASDTIRWDGTEGWLADWNHDHDLRSAIRYSVVWYYQELARRIGEERMQFWIDTVGYGNRDISGGIDRFWLDGGLRISAWEQVAFLDRLQRRTLPFSMRTQDLVNDIMILAQDSSSVFKGKTGWAMRDGSNTGWFIGMLEQADGNVLIFATMAVAADPVPDDFAQSRLRITQDFLNVIE